MHGAAVHPVLVELTLPGGGSLAIHSQGALLGLCIWLGWYLVVHTRHSEARRVRARAYAGAMIAGTVAAVAARFAGGSGAYPAATAACAGYWMLAPRSVRGQFGPALALLWMGASLGAWLDGWMYGRVASEVYASVGAFPAPSPAYLDHRVRGLIDPASTHSLPTSPVALYHLTIATLVAPIAYRVRKTSLALPIVMLALGISALAFDPFRADAFAGASSTALGLLLVAWSLASSWLVIAERRERERHAPS